MPDQSVCFDGADLAALKAMFDDLHDRPHVVVVDGVQRLALPQGWSEAKYDHPSPAPLVIGTLTGIVDYLATNVDGLELKNLIVHVKDFGTVELRGKVEAEAVKYRRATFLTASTAMCGPVPFKFGEYVDAESFFIGLQAGFVQDDAREGLLKFIASIRENNVRETVDDSVSQTVNLAGGVTLVGEARIPNPVVLRPFRTFRELEQPASRFVLRAQAGGPGGKPKLGLFEADGAAWKLTAVTSTAAWLAAKFTEKSISVAVVA